MAAVVEDPSVVISGCSKKDSKYNEFFEVPCRSKWVQCQRFEFFIQARRDRGLDKYDDLMAASIRPPGLDGKYQAIQFLDPELPD